ncbi:hypothetical protein AX15_002418 [Amanita polypyramis BW_CC]|nr:hypothetical protein AX15_002418 [Amanita polypyramis BW_CC]
MNRVALAAGTSVPTCFTLYTLNTYVASSFSASALLPPQPSLPRCNVPGTLGTVGYLQNGNFVALSYTGQQQRIMGSGNQFYFAMGSGRTISDYHWQAVDASVYGPHCAGSFIVDDYAPTTPQATSVNVEMNCGSQTGKQAAQFNFVFNGRNLVCGLLLTGHAGGTTEDVICAYDVSTASSCLVGQQQLGAATNAGFQQWVFSPT